MAEATVGAELRAAREARGLAIAEIAQRTRIPTRHLAAIEDGEYAGLPAATYSAGFVKTYARLLGLDGQELSSQFRAELAESATEPVRREIYEPADPARMPSRTLAWVSLLVAVAVIVGYLYWRGSVLSENPAKLAAAGPVEPAVAPAPTTTAPQPIAAPQAPPAPAAGQPALLTAISPVWIKVSEKGGPTLFMGVLDAGKSYTVPATAVDPRLQTGRPTALAVTVGGTAIPPLGAPERLIKDVSLKPSDLLARATPATAAPAPTGNGAAPE